MKNKKYNKYIIYFFAFFIIIGFILSIFIYYHKGFIYDSDGITQHYINLINFRRILINFFKTFTFNTFSWNVALGKDLFANLAYYNIGDFISYFSVFFKEEHMNIFYLLAVIARIFLAGISFIIYTNYKKKEYDSKCNRSTHICLLFIFTICISKASIFY